MRTGKLVSTGAWGRRMRAAGVAFGVAATGCGPASRSVPSAAPVLTTQTSGTTVLLQAISVVDDRVVWVSGHGGTFARTTDGGAIWVSGTVPGADTLQFRDVHAFDSLTAYLLSAGPGVLSTIRKTTDGGQSWTLQFLNPEPAGFYDCMDFWDASRGIAYGDAVAGQLRVLVTSDGGANWRRVAPERLPPAQIDEGGFAASGTCTAVRPEGNAWIATGNADTARVLYSSDWGETWSAAPTPLVSGSAAGATSIAFRDDRHGMVFGGDLTDGEGYTDNVARTSDGGRTWALVGGPRLPGAIYGGTYVPEAPSPTLIVVGPGGADYSVDGGSSWTRLDTASWWAVGAAGPGAVWLVGPEGRITRAVLWQ